MRILAIDQSTTKSGYALFSETDLTRWGVLDHHKNKDPDGRFQEMCKHIEELLKNIRPDLVVFEDVSLRQSVNVLIMLARLQGCIMEMCYTYDVDFVIYVPTKWRQLCGINQKKHAERDNLKKQAIAFVRGAYGIRVGDDCAEAICIGLAHLKQTGALEALDNLKRSHRNREKEKQNGEQADRVQTGTH